ncbi:uncharacterized protein LOC106154590 [Lingula anatina]|uniref:Uncharacterized protein LOC106154590 n=1 Tax=Lingula anatina TaxID=7574 RepID=A0A1S3HEF7_LINAN|nr:uncharacterized protein LOC106154590 [Lingula anatina]|eukprot:XP_013384438.1 uncharacterized protein LOC106154590 [Lingula anatina]
MIDRVQNNFYLTDSSLNGTYVNDIRIEGCCKLNLGDVIAFGHLMAAQIKPGQYEPQENSEFIYKFEIMPKEGGTEGTNNVTRDDSVHEDDNERTVLSDMDPNTLPKDNSRRCFSETAANRVRESLQLTDSVNTIYTVCENKMGLNHLDKDTKREMTPEIEQDLLEYQQFNIYDHRSDSTNICKAGQSITSEELSKLGSTVVIHKDLKNDKMLCQGQDKSKDDKESSIPNMGHKTDSQDLVLEHLSPQDFHLSVNDNQISRSDHSSNEAKTDQQILTSRDQMMFFMNGISATKTGDRDRPDPDLTGHGESLDLKEHPADLEGQGHSTDEDNTVFLEAVRRAQSFDACSMEDIFAESQDDGDDVAIHIDSSDSTHQLDNAVSHSIITGDSKHLGDNAVIDSSNTGDINHQHDNAESHVVSHDDDDDVDDNGIVHVKEMSSKRYGKRGRKLGNRGKHTAGSRKRKKSEDWYWHYDEDTCASYDCVKPTGSKVDWVQCDDCDKWYHTLCAGCSIDQVRDSSAEFHCGCL